MSANFDFDLFNEAVNNAPVAGFGPQVFFGKVGMKVDITSWKDGKLTLVPFTNQKLKDGQYFQVTFESILAEFNAALAKPYERRVDVKQTGNKGQKNESLTDWSETVLPSLVATLGADWSKKLSKGLYMQWEDVTTVEKDKSGKLRGYYKKENGETTDVRVTLSVPRFIKVFKSKAECAAAHAEKYAKKENGSDDFSVDSDIPQGVIDEARGIITALGGATAAREYLETSTPYSDYNTDDLIAAANPL